MTTDTKIIPSGYKQTEVGLIPNDWIVNRLEDIGNIATGSTPPTRDRSNYGEEFLFVSPSDIGNFVYINDAEKKLSSKGFALSRKFPKNSTLFVCIGSTIGKTGVASKELTSNQQINAVFPSNSSDHLYIYYILTYLSGRIKLLAGEQAVPQINKTQFQSTLIPLPPSKTEQTAIATALSGADALIEKLEKLIEKKKNIKQGAMQELLTGKRRLSGFSGDWEIKLMPDVAWFQEGPGVRTSQFTPSGVKLLNGTNIYKGKLLLDSTNRFISESEAFGPYSHFLVDEGDIVIASSGITIDKFEEKISFVKKEHLPLCMNTSTIRFKVRNNLLDSLFLYYFLMSKKFKDQIGAQATGSAQLNFGPSHVEKVEIFLPKDKKEQTAITAIISDMDTEIEKLESQLTKYQNIKQGMMQVLLTGKIRLISK